MNKRLPPDTVRGRIRAYIELHANKLGDNVLEVGSRVHNPGAWWLVNRDLAVGEWTGIDMQPGHGVDLVADIHALPPEWSGRFSGILCSEVMEHVIRPWVAIPELYRVVKPGGWVIVTTLFAFPEHGFPDDFWRYSRSGLAALMESAGFIDVETEYAGEIPITLNDHGEGMINKRVLPMHTFAVGRRPC